MTSSASRTETELIAEIHTPCDVGEPLPPRCVFEEHVNQGAVVVDRYKGRCRVARLRPGGQLLFGAQRPADVDNWLQIGRVEPDLPSAVSRVVGRIWYTTQAEGSRVLVENLSTNNALKLYSPRLPQQLTLFPAARAETGDRRDDLLDTPMAAVQTASTTLTISNKSTDFVVWIEAPIRRLLADGSLFTSSPRAPVGIREERELEDAALRIQLAAPENHTLLETFLLSEPAQEQLRSSESLRISSEPPASTPTSTGS